MDVLAEESFQLEIYKEKESKMTCLAAPKPRSPYGFPCNCLTNETADLYCRFESARSTSFNARRRSAEETTYPVTGTLR